MAKGQKETVVELVTLALGQDFIPGKSNALSMLTNSQLAHIKAEMYTQIMCGVVAYSKPLLCSEVKTYASSVVMNHLKKAKELTGGSCSSVSAVSTRPQSEKGSNIFSSRGIDVTSLPDYLVSVFTSETANE